MISYKIGFSFLLLVQFSYQYCHYSTNPALNNDGTCNCKQGFYNDNKQCLQCPNYSSHLNGFFSKKLSDCNTCLLGQQYMQQKGTDTQNAVCVMCPNNSTNGGQIEDNVKDESACDKCINGYIKTADAVAASGRNPAKAATCQVCPNNTYLFAFVSPNKCNACKDKFYGSVTQSGDLVCSLCPNNTANNYMPMNDPTGKVTDCKICQKGYYNTEPSLFKPPICQICPGLSNVNYKGARSIQQCVCDLNQYIVAVSTSTSAAICKPCPSGSTRIADVNVAGDESQCDYCQAGYYLLTQYQDPDGTTPAKSATCQICPNNSYSEQNISTSASVCSMCQLNYYMQTASDGTNSAICKPCLYNTGTLDPVKTVGDANQCTVCQPGYYMILPYKDGQAASCMQCPIGSTSDTVININKSKISKTKNKMNSYKIGLSFLLLIQFSYQYCHYATNPALNNDGTCNCSQGFYNNNKQCLQCPNYSSHLSGFYSKQLSDCNTCLSGQQYMLQKSTGTQNAVCVMCPNHSATDGQIQNSVNDESACYNCQNGYILTAFAVQASGGNPAKASTCQVCPNNTFLISFVSPKCNLCKDKFYGSVTQSGNTVCSLCPNNTANNYMPMLDPTGKVTDCQICQKGYYNIEPSLFRPPICQKCPGLSTTYYKGSQSIQECICDLNQYIVAVSTSTSAAICKPCPSGSTRIADVNVAGDESQCDYCQAGYYLLTQYQDPDGTTPAKSATCQICPNNSYSEQNISTSASVCSMCQLNYYMQTASDGTNSAICKPCLNNTGTLDPVKTVGDANQCTVCQPGYYMIQPYKDGQAASCMQCPIGSTSDTGFYFNNQNCQQCPNSSTSQDGQYALNPSDCSKCPFGTHYMTQASQPNQSASCVICPNNSFSKTISISDESSCVTCQSGYYKVSNAVDVSSGNQAKAAVCQKCPNNTFRSVNPDPNQQDLFDSVCYQCSEGFYMNQSNKCSLCPNNSTQYQFSSPPFTSKNCNACIVGYYNAESDPSKPVNCQKCPGNTTTLKASPGNISTCICSQNQYITAISTYFSAASCSPCPTGSGRLVKDFNVEGDESQCDVCLEGYYLIAPYQESDGKSVAKGAQCQICPHDSYSIAGTSTSLSSCSLCKINFYMTKPADQNNSAECQPCPGNTGTLAPASSVTDVCNVYGYEGYPSDSASTQGCQACAAGHYSNSSTFQMCTVCLVGTYASGTGNSQCSAQEKMQIYKTCLLLLVLSQLSYQYCHYSEQINPTNGICSCITGFYSDNQNCLQCDTLSTTSEDTLYPSLPSDCSICTLGTRMILKAFYPGQGAVCASCPNNSYSKQGYSKLLPISSCQTCQSGYYKVSNAIIDLGDNPPSEAVCQKCPNNTFRTTDPDPNIQDPNDNVCYQCSDGFYMNTRLTPSQNAQCSLCPNNSTQLQIAVIQSRFLQGVQLTFTSKDCNACIIGYYNAETDPSKPVNCQKCPGNTTTLEASNGDISTCICSQNQYTTAISSSSAAASCSPCPTGSGKLVKNFNVVGDESQCDVCLEGYYLITPYQESDGTSPAKGAQCQICPQNSYSIAGTSTSPSSCSLCKINYKMTKASDFTNNSAQCQLCPSNTGTLAPASALTDEKMQIYKTCLLLLVLIQLSYQYCHYSNLPNQQSNGNCVCMIGFYSNNNNCQICPNNSIARPSQAQKPSDCTDCPLGTYMTLQASQQYNQSALCITCPNNSYSKATSISDESSCVTCQSGYFKISDARATQGGNQGVAAGCQKCANNTFRTTIPDPNQKDLYDNVCNYCSDGFYMSARTLPTQNAQCSLCPNNTSMLQQAPIILSRLLQGVRLTFTSKDCQACIIGYYNAETDPTKPVNCQKCPGNTTTLKASNGDISTCICSQNQYTTAIPNSSAASCSPCPTGSGKLVQNFNVVGDESQCDVCLEGYYLIAPYQESGGTTPAKGAQCQICPQNSYSLGGTFTSPQSCNLCKINYFMQNDAFQDMSAECQPCPGFTGTLAPASTQLDKCNLSQQFYGKLKIEAVVEFVDKIQQMANTNAVGSFQKIKQDENYLYVDVQQVKFIFLVLNRSYLCMYAGTQHIIQRVNSFQDDSSQDIYI
ncbi:hypothetical protein ABPG73_017004 [Tetrahymena malaccensis]